MSGHRYSGTVPVPCSLFPQQAVSLTLGLCWAGPTASKHSLLVSQLISTHSQVLAYPETRLQAVLQEAFSDSPRILSLHPQSLESLLVRGPFIQSDS